MDNPILTLVFRWLHILPAIVLVGGTIFIRFAYQAPLASGQDDSSDDAAALTRGRWSKLVMASAGLLLLSGLFNTGMIAIKYQFAEKYYHPVLGVKIILALCVFLIASLLSGRSGAAERIRQKEKMWLNINVFLAVAVVLAGGLLKTADREVKEKDDKQESRHGAPLDSSAGA